MIPPTPRKSPTLRSGTISPATAPAKYPASSGMNRIEPRLGPWTRPGEEYEGRGREGRGFGEQHLFNTRADVIHELDARMPLLGKPDPRVALIIYTEPRHVGVELGGNQTRDPAPPRAPIDPRECETRAFVR